jgi:signal transduction histidine kinase/ActR/RegA family two-component response regulator
MSLLAALPPATLARARADEVAMLYASWHRTTLSMLLGALILWGVFWQQVAWLAMALWLALVILNQAWRALVARAWQRRAPGRDAAARWGRYWSFGAAMSGALWGIASIVLFPASPSHQALLIVCMFGVVLGGLNLTAVYKSSFYGFVLPALLPLIARVAIEGGPVHLYTAAVMTVVLVFVLAFGHKLNDVLTHALAIRYANMDLIEELKDQTRAAESARTAAESANLAKSQLLAAASHDLRQPLHALALFTAALAARTRGSELAPLVANVERATAGLDAQFTQLLDLSRLEANAFAPEHGRVALAPLFARLHAEFAPHAAVRGLRLTVASTTLAVDSDPALLLRVLQNLLSNALRYTERGGVLLGARRRGDAVAIDVVDTGLGIAAEHRERIFEEFYQVPTGSGARHGHGMGLGLAIVRRFAALLGHAVGITSRPGHGSRFRVTCARAREDAAAYAGLRPVVRQARSVTIAGALVAVMDDDPAAIEGMRALFTAWGARVAGGVHADAVLEALGSLECYPDLIVADLRLASGQSGLAAIARLREELGSQVPAVVVSGDVSATAARDVHAVGLPLLAKPVDATALQTVAAAFIAQAALVAQY